MGSYFTDIFFNHIYSTAKVSKNVTDEFVKHIQAYLKGVKTNEEYYSNIVQELHKYFINTKIISFTTLKYSDFVDKIVINCIPNGYYSQLTGEERDVLLSGIICDLIATLAAYVTSSEILHNIINTHDKTAQKTIRAMQDCAVSCLVEKRTQLHNQFVKKVGQVKDNISTDFVEDIKKSLKKLTKENADLIVNLEDADIEINGLKDKYKDYKHRLEESKNKLEESKNKLEESKTENAKLRKLIELMNTKKEKGVLAAANLIKQPKNNTIAENSIIRYNSEQIPRQEYIAEEHQDYFDEERPIPRQEYIAEKKYITQQKPVEVIRPNNSNINSNFFKKSNVIQSTLEKQPVLETILEEKQSKVVEENQPIIEKITQFKEVSNINSFAKYSNLLDD